MSPGGCPTRLFSYSLRYKNKTLGKLPVEVLDTRDGAKELDRENSRVNSEKND